MMCCNCGSGLPSEEMRDGHGIYLTRACEECRAEKLKEFRLDIFEPYETEEPIEPEDDSGEWVLGPDSLN